MICDKFAAHYMLSPRGEMVKWPVITINRDGVILNAECHKHRFKEQHGIKFYSGILLPAFIDIWWEYPPLAAHNVPENISAHFRNGTIYLGLPDAMYEFASKKTNQDLPFLSPRRIKHPRPEIFPNMGTKNSLSQLEKIKRVSMLNKDIPLCDILSTTTKDGAIATDRPDLGRLKTGCSPGLLLLQNADLINLKITREATIKWLNIPEKR